MELENKIRRYIPRNIVIGKGKIRQNVRKYDPGLEPITEISLPSCRFKMKTWTDMDTFESLSGYRPTNMADKTKEIEKMVTGNVFELENEPVSLKLVSYASSSPYMEYSYYMRIGYVILEDPRGFMVSVEAHDFINTVLTHGGTIESTHEIGNLKFVYSWLEDMHDSKKPGGFILTAVDSDEYKNAIFQDDLEQEINTRVKMKQSDLEIGKVYDYDTGARSDIRIMYVGKMNVVSTKVFSDILSSRFIRSFHDTVGLIKDCGKSLFQNSLYRRLSYPWESEMWRDCVSKYKKETKNMFLVLDGEVPRNTYGWYTGSRFNLELTQIFKDDLIVNESHYPTPSLLSNLRNFPVGLALKSISNNQSINIVAKSEQLSISGAEVARKCVTTYNEFVGFVERMMKLLPTERPSDEDQWIKDFIHYQLTEEDKKFLS